MREPSRPSLRSTVLLGRLPRRASDALSSSYFGGSCATHLLATQGGGIEIANTTVFINGTPVWSTAYAAASSGGHIAHITPVFSRAGGSGIRFAVASAGGIETQGKGASYLPDTVAGQTVAPGYYT